VSTGAPARTLRTSSGLDRTTRTSSFLDVQPLSLAGAGQEHLTKRSLDSVGRAATTESLPEASSSASRELATAADANNAGTPVATQGSNEPALQEFVPSATSAEEAADALWRAQTEVLGVLRASRGGLYYREADPKRAGKPLGGLALASGCRQQRRKPGWGQWRRGLGAAHSGSNGQWPRHAGIRLRSGGRLVAQELWYAAAVAAQRCSCTVATASVLWLW
jgi:hypothetical protein